MCAPAIAAAPLFAASLAVTAVTGVISYIGQQQQAEAMAEAQAANNENLRRAAIGDMVQKTNDLNARQQQETASTALRIQNQKTAAREAQATAMASSEAAGLSVEQLFADYDRQYLSYADSQMQQLGFTEEQIARQRQSIEAQTKSRINSGWDNSPIQQPSLGAALMGIAAGGLQSYQTFSTIDPDTGKRTLY